MSTLHRVANGRGPDDIWWASPRGVTEFYTRESDTALMRALLYWLARKASNRSRVLDPMKGSMPEGFEEFGAPPTMASHTPAFDHMAHATVTDPDPTQYLLNTPGSASTRVCDLPTKLLQRVVMEDLMQCKERARPMYQEIEALSLGRHTCYTRLMLPVADENGVVCRVYIQVRPLDGTAIEDGARLAI